MYSDRRGQGAEGEDGFEGRHRQCEEGGCLGQRGQAEVAWGDLMAESSGQLVDAELILFLWLLFSTATD